MTETKRTTVTLPIETLAAMDYAVRKLGAHPKTDAAKIRILLNYAIREISAVHIDVKVEHGGRRKGAGRKR